MTRLRAFPGEDHRQVRALLPWYVTGQLEDAEALRVEAHLDSCRACQTELAVERRLRDAILSAPMEEGRESSPPRRRFAFGAAAIGAIAASIATVAVTTLSPPHPPAQHVIYRTLGDPAAPAVGELVVLFDPTLPEGEMSAILARAHARIVDGPTAQGAYVLRVPHGSREAALATLRSAPGVRLAQSLGGPG